MFLEVTLSIISLYCLCRTAGHRSDSECSQCCTGYHSCCAVFSGPGNWKWSILWHRLLHILRRCCNIFPWTNEENRDLCAVQVSQSGNVHLFSFCVGSNDQSWGSYFSLWFHKLLVIQSYCMNQIFCKSTPSRLGGHIFKKYVTIGLYIYNSIRAVLLWIKNGEVLELYYFRLK